MWTAALLWLCAASSADRKSPPGLPRTGLWAPRAVPLPKSSLFQKGHGGAQSRANLWSNRYEPPASLMKDEPFLPRTQLLPTLPPLPAFPKVPLLAPPKVPPPPAVLSEPSVEVPPPTAVLSPSAPSDWTEPRRVLDEFSVSKPLRLTKPAMPESSTPSLESSTMSLESSTTALSRDAMVEDTLSEDSLSDDAMRDTLDSRMDVVDEEANSEASQEALQASDPILAKLDNIAATLHAMRHPAKQDFPEMAMAPRVAARDAPVAPARLGVTQLHQHVTKAVPPSVKLPKPVLAHPDPPVPKMMESHTPAPAEAPRPELSALRNRLMESEHGLNRLFGDDPPTTPPHPRPKVLKLALVRRVVGAVRFTGAMPAKPVEVPLASIYTR